MVSSPLRLLTLAGLGLAAALAAGALPAGRFEPDSAHGHEALVEARDAAAHACPTPSAARRARRALAGAEARFSLESSGVVIHRDLRRIAADAALTRALRAHLLSGALVAAERQLVRHVVRIRVLSGSHVLVDANPTSFDVAGSRLTLSVPAAGRRYALQITVQDVIGFDKLVHRLLHADAVVRGAGGQMRTTIPAAAHMSLPDSGCVTIGARRYVVGTLRRSSFTGEALRISVLTPA